MLLQFLPNTFPVPSINCCLKFLYISQFPEILISNPVRLEDVIYHPEASNNTRRLYLLMKVCNFLTHVLFSIHVFVALNKIFFIFKLNIHALVNLIIEIWLIRDYMSLRSQNALYAQLNFMTKSSFVPPLAVFMLPKQQNLCISYLQPKVQFYSVYLQSHFLESSSSLVVFSSMFCFLLVTNHISQQILKSYSQFLFCHLLYSFISNLPLL